MSMSLVRTVLAVLGGTSAVSYGLLRVAARVAAVVRSAQADSQRAIEMHSKPLTITGSWYFRWLRRSNAAGLRHSKREVGLLEDVAKATKARSTRRAQGRLFRARLHPYGWRWLRAALDLPPPRRDE